MLYLHPPSKFKIYNMTRGYMYIVLSNKLVLIYVYRSLVVEHFAT